MTAVETVLAFDFGTRRIGLASGDTLTRSAAPRPPVAVTDSGPDWEGIARTARARAGAAHRRRPV